MLPDSPKLKNEILKKLEAEVKQEVSGEYGLLDMFQTTFSHEGDEYTYSRVDGSVHAMQGKWHGSKVSLSVEDIATYDYSKAKRLLICAYRDVHNQMTKSVFEVVDEAVHETGNVIDAKGGCFTQEMFLEMLSKIQTNPDDPGGLCIVAHPDMAEKLAKVAQDWSQDEEFKAKWQTLNEQKRREWLDQEGHRKLVD